MGLNNELDAQIEEIEGQVPGDSEIEGQVPEDPEKIEDQVPDVPESGEQDPEAPGYSVALNHPQLAAGFDDETLGAMWRTTTTFSEQYLTNREPTDRLLQRWTMLKKAFLDNPRWYYVADCSNCDWFAGGWMTQSKANHALRRHESDTHQIPSSEKS
jgi:hypothetical protein